MYRESVAGWGHVMFMLKAAPALEHAESSDPDGEPQPTVCAANTHTMNAPINLESFEATIIV